MSRPVAIVLMLAGLVPWAFLLVLGAISALGVYSALGDPLGCIAESPAATAGMVWLAIAPVLAAACTAIVALRRGGPRAGSPKAATAGLALLVAGIPITLLANGRTACAASDLAGDGGESIPIEGWGVGTALLVLLTFGTVCAAGLRLEAGT